jgi:AraC-like DNA-binding protein
MADYCKYLTVSEEDINWGLYINVAGISTVPPHCHYPLPNHPKNYNFKWENGRIIHEYQVNYISSGSGIMETKSGNYKVNAGSVLLLFPGIWHRYKPDYNIGWTEHYIGFNGLFTESLFSHELFDKHNPVLKIGFHVSLANEFNELLQIVKDEKPGYQQECSGKLIFLLGRMISIVKNNEFANKEMERNIRKACVYLRDNVNKNVCIELLANDLNIGYSHFRRMFKKYTGQSPNQYHLGLRIQKSKELLLHSNKSIKNIAQELGFDSIHYFSRIYKNKEGVSPSSLRSK